MDVPRHAFWTNKLDYLENLGVHAYLGRVNSSGQEKGVDVSLALDLVQAAQEDRQEAAMIVSQDADFGPVVFLYQSQGGMCISGVLRVGVGVAGQGAGS